MVVKNYVVIGLGNFGKSMALELAGLGEEVLALDLDARKVEEIKAEVTECVIADGRDRGTLAEFVGADIDAAILNLGDNLESIALTTLNLVDIGVRRIIVKAKTPEFGKIVRAIGATELINPEQEGARQLARKLHEPNLIEHIPLDPEYDIVEVAVPESYTGKTLGELDLRKKKGIVVIAIKEILSGKINLIPGADFRFAPDTAMILIGTRKDIQGLSL